jgi:hypothetical protein
MARAANTRNTFACLILGSYQVALDRATAAATSSTGSRCPSSSTSTASSPTDAATLVREAEDGVRGNLQARAAAIVQRYGQLGHEPRGMFDVMLKYARSEDGSLHAEKFYRTASDEFANTRPAFRWRQLVALARVTASEYGRPRAGMAEAREMLKV